MEHKIEAVKYVGPALLSRLNDQGILSVEQLAAMSVEELSAISGVGASMAPRILASARELLETPVTEAPKPKAPKRPRTPRKAAPEAGTGATETHTVNSSVSMTAAEKADADVGAGQTVMIEPETDTVIEPVTESLALASGRPATGSEPSEVMLTQSESEPVPELVDVCIDEVAGEPLPDSGIKPEKAKKKTKKASKKLKKLKKQLKKQLKKEMKKERQAEQKSAKKAGKKAAGKKA